MKHTAILLFVLGLGWFAASAAEPPTATNAPTTEGSSSPNLRSTVWLAPSPQSVRPAASQVPRASESVGRWFAEPIRQQVAQILSFDAKRIRLKLSDAKDDQQHIAISVVWIESPPSGTAEATAWRQFRDGDDEAAMKSFLDAVETRPPVWRQQWLSMAAAQCAKRASQTAIALELVRQLDRRPLPPMTVGWLPIAWRPSDRSDATRVALAVEATADASPAVRLIASSWLPASEIALMNRTTDSLIKQADRPRIAELAKVLRLKYATPPQVRDRWKSYETQIESMPLTMRMGPWLLLRDKLSASGLEAPAHKLTTSLEVTPICPHPEVSLNF